MGQFISSEIAITTYTRARLVVDFTPNSSNNTNYVSAYVQMWRTNTGYTTYGSGTLYIGVDGHGWEASTISPSQKVTYNSYTQIGGTRSLTITGGSDGRWTANFHVYTVTNNDRMTFSTHSFTVTLAPNPVYALSISAGAGSSITVNRTYCAGSGGTGILSAGANKLYYGDTLKISFSPSSNYAISTHTVNGSSFVSDNTHTVSGNVSVVATATQLKSAISATDADIESVSTIIITQYSPSRTHTITYQLGSATGTIVTKSTATTIPWTIPSSFYAQIANSKIGFCTLTCETFDGDKSMGTSSCTLTVTAAAGKCHPLITASAVDMNETTKALTGDDRRLIRYKSDVLCTLTAAAQNSARISTLYIAGENAHGVTADGVTTATKLCEDVSDKSFSFAASDSRDYGVAETITLDMVPYINLTCNPILSRPTPTGGAVVMTVSGDMFQGFFDNDEKHRNTLVLQYRYKEVGGSYGDWQDVDMSQIVYGTASYRSLEAITLTPRPDDVDEDGNPVQGFDYQKNYVFTIRAVDGSTVEGTRYNLSQADRDAPVNRGIPLFDWGENDFNFNVPIMFKNMNIFDIVYPVGAVYMHSSSTLPTALSNAGTWASVTTGISGVYAWKRTA